MKTSPYIFDEFFASGKEESISPFLTASSKSWGKNLSLKVALLSAFCLLLAYIATFTQGGWGTIPLLFVYFFSGTPALIHAIEDLKKWEVNIDILMTLAAFLSIFIGSSLEGALLLVLFELSASMEESVSYKTKGALLHLHELSPKFASVFYEGELRERAVKEIEPGTLLLIQSGEIVPLDSKVVAGNSSIELKHLTGESTPCAKQVGDEIPAGAYNLDGTLTVEVLRSYSNSTLTKIIELITEAGKAKPKLERFLDRFGKWYAMSIISLSLTFTLFLPLLLDIPFTGKEGSIYRSLAFLVTASPCALIIATPTAYLSAISSCAKQGILLKGGTVLDALAKCTIIAFDKTGTLTSGELTCSQIVALNRCNIDFSLNQALSCAASLEQNATHPIGKAIYKAAKEKKLPIYQAENFCSFPGRGIAGSIVIDGITYLCAIGNAQFIEPKLQKPIPPIDDIAKQTHTSKPKTTTFLLIDKELFHIELEDEIRSSAYSSIQKLRESFNLDLLILSGDKQQSVEHVAAFMGIPHIAAELSPAHKLLKVAELSKTKGLIMVGDGINDAPALARATVGIALGKIGSATAIEASDVVFMNDELTSIPWLLKKAKATTSIIQQNLILALGVILFATTPALLGIIPLWLAVILHEGGTLLVGLNSLRLLRN